MKKLNRIFLIGGILLLAYLVYRVGPAKLVDDMIGAGWGLGWVVLVALTSIIVMALGWKALLAPGKSRANVW